MILVTGGTGYIGSHTTLLLLEAGHDVVVVDNLSNSSYESLRRVSRLCNKNITFVEADIRDSGALEKVFEQYPIESVVHFAGLKAVGESVSEPLKYYDNNVTGSVVLLEAMDKANVRNIVFSSSATVYGEPKEIPISESCPTAVPTNPYGHSKLMVEHILHGVCESNPEWRVGVLRYFNPIGAHESGMIGEDPGGIPNNLMPYIAQVAAGIRSELSIFGDDYPTPDGTGIRDYIHVVDLAQGHLNALGALTAKKGMQIWNLGTGKGYSVLEMVAAFEKASGRKVPYVIAPRREGDVAECWSNPAKAKQELNWEAARGLDEMVRDVWNWQAKNPNGYET
ncbi:MAG: UDP-glucose 4-epimerase GalE [Gammaproteobacteria bacterium]|nr:MAG: UDP-glucose 4-epimerase GalE [Gammaproteobacteria bacterium]